MLIVMWPDVEGWAGRLGTHRAARGTVRCREVDAPMPRFSGASRGVRTPCARKEMERAARGQLVCPWTVCGGRGCARARARVCVSVKRMRGAVDPASTDQPSTDRWLEMQSGSFGSNHGRSYGERRLVAHHLECLRWCVCACVCARWGGVSSLDRERSDIQGRLVLQPQVGAAPFAGQL